MWVRDYDSWDACKCEAPEWYDVAIDEDARRAWNRVNGWISADDWAMVINGRKLVSGFNGVIDRIHPVLDHYGRRVAD